MGFDTPTRCSAARTSLSELQDDSVKTVDAQKSIMIKRIRSLVISAMGISAASTVLSNLYESDTYSGFAQMGISITDVFPSPVVIVNFLFCELVVAPHSRVVPVYFVCGWRFGNR